MKRILLLFVSLAAAWNAAAKVDLPEIFSDNMILQRNTAVKLWGWADPHAVVKVRTSWGVKCAVRSDALGRWEALVDTAEGGYAPQRIVVESGDKVVLDNVLIGEVWFAGGQSNMDMPLNGFYNCPVVDANRIIACADAWRDRIRYVKIPRTASLTPGDRVAGKWRELSSATAPRCTATGFFFASMLNEALDVPIGIIDCSWGGSRVESWCDRKTLEAYPDVDLSAEAIEKLDPMLRPMVMYNGMVHPVAGYTIRGYIWYQGESNVGAHDVYAERLARMVELWRNEWGLVELPFYYVEIAPYRYGGIERAAYLREAQCRAQQLIPASGMISTNDLVAPHEYDNIHPADKRGVGHRLACMALNKTYGMEQVACESPRFHAVEFTDGKALITLTALKRGYNRMSGIEGFEVCGADRVFRPADVAVDSQLRLVIFSEKVPEPVAVRYCFRDCQVGNLADTRGLPVIPFRTDDYPPEHN